MTHRTAAAAVAAEPEQLPADIETMRATVRQALAEDVELAAADLDTLSLALRGHMEVLIPEVTVAAGQQPKDSSPRYCAMACVGEARRKLQIGNGETQPVRIAVVQKLARSVSALCDHLEGLGVAPAP